MRVISQDGTMDVPYEKFIFYIAADNSIIATRNFEGYPDSLFSGRIAEYSSREKTKRAMKLLRTSYIGRFITNSEVPEDFEKGMKELMKGGFGTVIVRDSHSRVEFDNLNGYFQFPQDDEV